MAALPNLNPPYKIKEIKFLKVFTLILSLSSKTVLLDVGVEPGQTDT